MISHRRFKRCLQSPEALIDGSGILAIELDHLGTRLAAADHLEGI